MKKLAIAIMLSLLFFTLGCTSAKEKKEISLTKDNYMDYLKIEYKIENCVVNNNTYYCNVFVSSKAKNGATFTDAEITFSLHQYGFIAYNSIENPNTTTYMYTPQGQYTLYLDNNGEASTSVSMQSLTSNSFPSTSKLKFIVKKISGKAFY